MKITRHDLQLLLARRFDRETGLEILQEVFGQDFVPYSTMKTDTLKAVGTARYLGEICFDNEVKKITVLEVSVTERNVVRTRVALRNATKRYIDGLETFGVLAFFHSPDLEQYRLSFISRMKIANIISGKAEVHETAPRRFTYVLGPNCSVATPAQRLCAYSETSNRNLRDFTDAFSVDVVSKEFFTKYHEFYREITECISNDRTRALFGVAKKRTETEQRAADKPLRDFSKKLLGRLVFLKFLEKKGWLGATEYARRDGDPDFLMRLFRHTTDKERFYPDVLVPLFFETLNRKRPEDVFGITKTKVPFLNGGLFDPDYDVDACDRKLKLPGSLFDRIFTFFNEYNFTIDENDENDAEIGVDPEMLGRIFEQLIEDNEKDMQGTIYTPFQVVRFMCRNALILYVCRKLGVEPESPKGQAVKAFIVNENPECLTEADRTLILRVLKEVKILDPAVGSGAFPMGMMRELLEARHILEPDASRERLKREIIRNSIYGVDIDRGAVDIARLRFFLALVVDADLPEPLPNLDFKLMQGDSLAEDYEGVDLCMKSSDLLDGAVRGQFGLDFTGKDVTRSTLIRAIGRYYETTDHEEKEKLDEAIRDTVARFVTDRLADHGRKINPAELSRLLRREAPFFLWHLYFRDVFESGGFDIIIGNPPYRAMQENANDNSQNRKYPVIDSRVRETFVKTSRATNNNQIYDLFVRFFRLVFDFSARSEKKSIIAFITNYSYLDAFTFDGFRKDAQKSFSDIYLLNLKGDARTSGMERQRNGGNIFNDSIRVGITVGLFIPGTREKSCTIHYEEVPDYTTCEEKSSFVAEERKYRTIVPDSKGNWLNQSGSDFERHMKICSPEGKSGSESDVIFKLYSCGVKSNRDEWVYDFDRDNLEKKVKFFMDVYNRCLNRGKTAELDPRIKWARELTYCLNRKTRLVFDEKKIVPSVFRPFVKMYLYFSKEMNEMVYQMPKIHPVDSLICISGIGSSKPFQTLGLEATPSLDILEKTQCFPLYRYENGRRVENVTDWALSEFRRHYGDLRITKEDIFHYVYAVLHDPVYREKYAIDLKQEYPRIPFHERFTDWANMGKELMELHIGFENAPEYPGIVFHEADGLKSGKTHRAEYTKKPDGTREFSGTVTFCDGSRLTGIPPVAFEYRLGNKSAIEWILDRYVAPSYATDEEVKKGRKLREDERVLRDNFSAFRFSDYRSAVVSLIRKVTTVSVRTVEIQERLRSSSLTERVNTAHV